MKKVEDCNAFIGVLESFIEERGVYSDVEPYSGQPYTTKEQGRPLGPWEVDMRDEFPLLFTVRKEARTKQVLWSLAEMENVRQRTKRDADSTRKYAVQGFAQALLDVADNLSRATGAVPEGIVKANVEDDASGNIKVLQNLLQGVEMTERQLLQVSWNITR